MSQPSPSPNRGASEFQVDLESIRHTLLQKSPADIERELPGLIKVVRTQELGHDETIRYVIGVSFTTNQTCFDYWVDRVVLPHDGSRYIRRPEKEPIDSGHPYLTFAYPPDSQFDGEALRGILLATIENRINSNRKTEIEEGQAVGRLRALFRSVSQRFG